MGDSITFGQHLDPSLRWTALVEERLLARFPGIELLSMNRGVSGDTTRTGLERFPADVQRAEADVMTLQFGLNDCNCWETDCGLPRVSEAAFVANLHEMIVRARRFGVREIVMQTNHRTLRKSALPSTEVYEDANSRYTELLRSVARERGIPLCDVRAAFDPLTDEELERLLLPAPDLLHLSAAGNEVYAHAVYPFVDEAVERVLAIDRGREVQRT